jgi:hypothetical protein
VSDKLERFMAETTDAMRPLIDALAAEVGESPEAWRGVSMTCNGLARIISKAADSEMPPIVLLSTIVAVLAAIEDHPAYVAASAHWRKP